MYINAAGLSLFAVRARETKPSHPLRPIGLYYVRTMYLYTIYVHKRKEFQIIEVELLYKPFSKSFIILCQGLFRNSHYSELV